MMQICRTDPADQARSYVKPMGVQVLQVLYFVNKSPNQRVSPSEKHEFKYTAQHCRQLSTLFSYGQKPSNTAERVFT